MKVLLVPDSFKGTLSSGAVAEAMARAVRDRFPGAEITSLSFADGGEGTVRAVLGAVPGKLRKSEVQNPWDEPVTAEWGVIEDGTRAVIEVAAASGLCLVPPEERRPLAASTFGTGELVREAIEEGIRRVLLGLGGSATVDCGAGLLQALGMRFLDAGGETVDVCGGNLAKVEALDDSRLIPELKETEILVATDVDNLLLGPRGAAKVFGPQKGATPAEVHYLETGLTHFANLLEESFEINVGGFPGSGAAGGIAAGLRPFSRLSVVSGGKFLAGLMRLPEKMAAVDLVITGEGRLDRQTLGGKAIKVIADLGREAGKPVWAVVGGSEAGDEVKAALGLGQVVDLTRVSGSKEEAMARPEHWIFLGLREALADFPG